MPIESIGKSFFRRGSPMHQFVPKSVSYARFGSKILPRPRFYQRFPSSINAERDLQKGELTANNFFLWPLFR